MSTRRIDLDALQAQVNREVDGAQAVFDVEKRFLNIQFVPKNSGGRLLMDVYPLGVVYSSGCVWSGPTRRLLRIVLDAVETP